MNKEKNTEISEEKEENYMSIGMSIGMCLGVAGGAVVGSCINNISICMCFGICIGMCLGMAIGSAIKKDISNVYADETTTNIIMKQKENPNMNDKTNVWYAIVDNSQLKDNVKITIEHKNFNNENVIEISKLPLDYSVDTAIKDGCFVLRNNKVVSPDEKQLDEFIEKTKKGESSFIRVYSNYGGEITITDVNFEDGIYYTNTIVLGTERKYHNTYKNLKREEIRNGDYKDIEYVFYEGRNPNGGVPLVIIQNWLEDYKKNQK